MLRIVSNISPRMEIVLSFGTGETEREGKSKGGLELHCKEDAQSLDHKYREKLLSRILQEVLKYWIQREIKVKKNFKSRQRNILFILKSSSMDGRCY